MQLTRAAQLTRSGATQLDAVAATVRAITAAASTARSPAADRAILAALHSQMTHAQHVVSAARQEAARLADDIQTLTYDGGRLGEHPGQNPPPPPPPPPPRLPGPNDDPWTHGGDRRWSSIASAGLKQKLVAAALLEMERNGQDHAAAMLQQYLGNSGEPVALAPDLVDAWLTETINGYGPLDPAQNPAALIQSNLAAIIGNARGEVHRTGRTITIAGNTPWATAAGSDGDAVRTLGHYAASTAYTISMNLDGTYSMTYRNDLYDWCNFATTRPMPWDTARAISNAAHDLHAVGYAQDFLITGSGTTQTIQGTHPR
jgi:hypothetical protein